MLMIGCIFVIPFFIQTQPPIIGISFEETYNGEKKFVFIEDA